METVRVIQLSELLQLNLLLMGVVFAGSVFDLLSEILILAIVLL